MMDVQTRKKRYKELVFFLAILIKMMVQSITMSVIPTMIGVDLCEKVFKLMTYSSYLLVIVSFLLDPCFKARELIIIFLVISISVIGSYFSGNGIMLTLIYLYGAKNINIEKVVKRLAIFYIIIFSCIIISSQIGIIENWDFFANTPRPRWGVGYTYPTHTSSALFMAVLLFCYIRKGKLHIWHILIIELVNFWIYKKTDSRAGAAFSAIVPIVFYCIRFSKKPSYKSKIAWLLQWAFPACALLIYILTVKFNDQGIYKTINSLLSGRLNYGQYSMNLYGVHLFGQKIAWVGWGGYGHTTFQLTQTYNYVDTSYLKLLLENGIIVWGIIMTGWTMTSIYAYRQNKKYLLLSLSILAVYCMAEQWLMNIGANLFIIMLAYPIYGSLNKRVNQTEYICLDNISD